MRRIVLIAHNIRSTHNVGSLLRTAEGLGVEKVYLTGYTPYPLSPADDRLPHIARKLDAQIHKTALEAERLIAWEHQSDIAAAFATLRHDRFQIVALEQDRRAAKSTDFNASGRVALLVGREVEGIEPQILDACDAIVEIPMRGRKESFNVAVAAAMMLYQLAI